MEEDEQEKKVEIERMFNLSIHSVPESTLDEFRAFARTYAYNKYALALRVLLDRSVNLEIYANHESRIRLLEDAAITAKPEEKEEGRKIRTFGGVKR